MTIGEKLKETREKKDLTLEKIEEITKIRKKYLQAIENDNFEIIPGEIYIKSFIKTYGNSLGLNGDKLAQEYENRMMQQKQLLEERETNYKEVSFFEKYKVIIISFIILILISSFFYIYFFIYGKNLSFDLSIINILNNTLEKVKEYFTSETENFSDFFSKIKQELEKFLK